MNAPKKRATRINVGGRLFAGPLSGRVYWAPRVTAKPLGDGTALFYVVGDKRDVTDMFILCAKELGWTPPVLEDEERACLDTDDQE